MVLRRKDDKPFSEPTLTQFTPLGGGGGGGGGGGRGGGGGGCTSRYTKLITKMKHNPQCNTKPLNTVVRLQK